MPSIRRASLLLAAALISVASFALSAEAFRVSDDVPGARDSPTPPRWALLDLDVEVVGALPPGLESAAVRDAVRSAFSVWAAVDCGGPRFSFRGFVDRPSREPGVISVFWESPWRGPPRALGNTELTYGRSATQDGQVWIRDATIALNGERYAWSADPRGTTASRRDVQAVLVHEVGHALGLRHNCDEAPGPGGRACTRVDALATMFPGYRGVAQRMLGLDDIRGLCFLYDR